MKKQEFPEFAEFVKQINPQVDFHKIIESKAPFVDETFRPDINSLVHKSQKELFDDWNNCIWKKPKEIFGSSDYEVFKGIDITDIKQGALGDCYLLACIASLAEKPNRIMDLFETKTVNEAGCYVVKPFVAGCQRTIVLDDSFPYDPNNDQYLCAKPAENELWVLLLEKAWAKVNGGYSKITGGSCEKAFEFLTGAPTEGIYHYFKEGDFTQDDLWKKIKSADEQNFIMTASTSTMVTRRLYEKTNIATYHAYSLLNAYEFEHNGQNVRLLQMKNPWGTGEYTGPWSDNWEGWTPELKKKLNHESKDDGIFFIPFDEYIKMYSKTTICMFKEGYVHTNMTIKANESAAYAFNLKEDLKGRIEFGMFDERLLPDSIADELNNARAAYLMLAKIENGKLKHCMNLTSSFEKRYHREINLNKGTYVIFTSGYYHPSLMNCHNIHIYADHKFEPLEFPFCMEAFAETALDEARLNQTNEMWLPLGREIPMRYIKALGLNGKKYKIWHKQPKDLVIYPERFTDNPHYIDEGDDFILICAPNKDCSGCENNDTWGYTIVATTETSIGHKTYRPETIAFIRDILSKLCGIDPATVISSVSLEDHKKPEAKSAPVEELKVAQPASTTQCFSKHPLKILFSNEVNGTTFTCKKCNATGSTLDGRWACDKCAYSICNACAPIPEITCANKHLLCYAVALPDKESYECAKCKKSYETKNGFLFCPDCNYIMCCECANPKSAVVEPYCDNKHRLFYAFNEGEFKCKKCNNIIIGKEGRWQCYLDSFNVCEKCLAKPTNMVTTDIKDQVYCPKGHCLKFVQNVVENADVTFTCGACSKAHKNCQGRFECKKCNYAKCVECIPVSYVNGVTKLCLQGHPLISLKPTGPEAAEFLRCAKCKRARQKAIGYKKCLICDYDLCSSCSP